MGSAALPLSALLAIGLAAACSADASVRAGAGTTPSGGTRDAPPPPAATRDMPPPAGRAPPAAARDTPPPAAPTPPAAAPGPRPGCGLACTNLNRRARLAQADEARLREELAGEIEALHACWSGGPLPALTLRFDGAGALSHFGVDADADGEPPCLAAIRARRPAVTLAGPATVRCVERCPP